MNSKQTHPQYLLDRSGKKAFVVLPVETYEELMEDLYDLAIMAERRHEPHMSFEEFEAGLKADGIL